MQKFNLGIRFQPIGQNHTDESAIANSHWALIFTSYNYPKWSLRVELARDGEDIIYFPVMVYDEEVYAHEIGTYTGYLDDIVRLMEVHPMRGTSYSAAFNNCQHWAATLLILLETFGRSEWGREFSVFESDRYSSILKVLAREGSSIYHTPNWYMDQLGVMTVGGGAAVAGATVATANATTVVSAGGIAGWFGATVTVPAYGALVATVTTAAIPFVAVGAGLMAGNYLYQNNVWKSRTMFKDPRVHGCPKGGEPLSGVEKGESCSGIGSFSRSQGAGGLSSGLSSGFSSGFSSGLACGALLGWYAGTHAGAITSACSPGAAGSIAPAAARAVEIARAAAEASSAASAKPRKGNMFSLSWKKLFLWGAKKYIRSQVAKIL